MKQKQWTIDLIAKKKSYRDRLNRSLQLHQEPEDRQYCLDELDEVESDIKLFEDWEVVEDEPLEDKPGGKRETRTKHKQ